MRERMISREYDKLFDKYSAGFIPADYLRTLSYSESRLDPKNITKPAGQKYGAVGLLQVVYSVLNDWNKAHPDKQYTFDDMTDEEKNVEVGVWHLERIIRALQKHPSTKMNWDDLRYIGLLTAAFNAGYSEKSGLGFVVGKMEKADIPKERINTDTVQQAGISLKAQNEPVSQYLLIPDRLKYWNLVVSRYAKERGLAKPMLAEVGNGIHKESENGDTALMFVAGFFFTLSAFATLGRHLLHRRK